MTDILYCKGCGWESADSNVGIKNECPDCGASLYFKPQPYLAFSSGMTKKIGMCNFRPGKWEDQLDNKALG